MSEAAAAAPAHTPVVFKCSSCDTTTSLQGMLSERRRWLFWKLRECPACVEKQHQRMARRTLFWMLLFLLVGAGLAAYNPESGWLILNLVTLQIAVALMIAPHELGHHLAARALGLRVPMVIIGVGRLLGKARIFGARWSWNLIPLGGMTVVSDAGRPGFRWRLWLSVLAGPMVSFFVLVPILLISVMRTGLPNFELIPDLHTGPRPMAALVWANVLILVINLLPFRSLNVVGQKQGTDGYLLLTLPFISATKVDELRATTAAAEAHLLLMEDHKEEAKAIAETAIARYPENVHLRNVHAIIDLSIGNYRASRLAFLDTLESEETPLFRAMLSSNVAWSCILIGSAELLEEADRHSATAFEAMPWSPAVLNTRGVVMAMTGRPVDGLALLQKAWLQEKEPKTRSTVMMGMAYAYTMLGKTADADALIDSLRQQGFEDFENDTLYARVLDERARQHTAGDSGTESPRS